MRKYFSVILTALVLSFVLCTAVFAGNGDGKGGGNGSGGGSNALNVTSVTVNDADLEGAVLQGDITIKIVFDRGMSENFDANCANLKLTKDDEELAATVSEGDKGVYNIELGSAEAGNYVLVIGSEVKANNGNTLGEDYKVSFTVEGAAEGEATEEAEPTAEPEPVAEPEQGSTSSTVVMVTVVGIAAIVSFYASKKRNR